MRGEKRSGAEGESAAANLLLCAHEAMLSEVMREIECECKGKRWGGGAQERSRSKPFSIRRRFFLLTRLLIFEAIEASDARRAWQRFTLAANCTLMALEVAVASEPSFHSTGGAS